MLGSVFLHVIPIASCLLNRTSDKIRNNYILVLNQLSNNHLIFKKLLCIDRDSDHIFPAQVQICMNKVDLKLEQFMKLAESDNHKNLSATTSSGSHMPEFGFINNGSWLASKLTSREGLRTPATYSKNVKCTVLKILSRLPEMS